MKREKMTKCEKLGALLYVAGVAGVLFQLVGFGMVDCVIFAGLGLTFLILQLVVDDIAGGASSWLD